MPHRFRISYAGDSALIIELPARLDAALNARAVAIAEGIRQRCSVSVRDVVVGYHTVTVYFDPLHVDSGWLEDELASVTRVTDAPAHETGGFIEVPVCYGGELGPDLAEVAATAGCPEEEIVAIHSGREYRVFVVGFVPGFAYMGPVDDRLALPRRSTPRTQVPAGSVAIAAGQTGIYPIETPGGWHLLGRTPVRPFDPARTEAVLFSPGDRVRFVPITREEYARAASW